MPTIHLLIKGKVQGVFYRASAKKAAVALGIRGWVRNKDNGDVEAVATGDPGQLKEFANWCHRGPDGASVSSVTETTMEEQSFDSFSIRH